MAGRESSMLSGGRPQERKDHSQQRERQQREWASPCIPAACEESLSSKNNSHLYSSWQLREWNHPSFHCSLLDEPRRYPPADLLRRQKSRDVRRFEAAHVVGVFRCRRSVSCQDWNNQHWLLMQECRNSVFAAIWRKSQIRYNFEVLHWSAFMLC